MRHVLLVGATDGIGLALAREYLRHRWRVGIIGRDADKLERVRSGLRSDFADPSLACVACDVTDVDRVESAFEEGLRALGQLDLLVYCAGIMRSADNPDGRGRTARQMFSVNAAAAAHFLELGAGYLREVGAGQLAALGSVAGDRGRKGNPAYGASKAGLHAYLEGLRHRMHGTGVTVSTVKPGWVRTRMLARDFRIAIEPEDAAQRIHDGLQRRREVLYVPWWWRFVGFTLRWSPRFLMHRFGPA